MNGSREYEMAQFSAECPTTKAKVIPLANKIGRKQSIEPIKTPSKYAQLTQRLGTHVKASHEWFWFHF